MALLDGKIALVTGAANGIGKASALALAREGARVLAFDRGSDLEGRTEDPSALEALRAELAVLGPDHRVVAGTVATEEGAELAVQSAVQAFGGLDIAVHAAGIVRDRTALKMSVEDFDAVLAVQLRGTFLGARAAARRMVEQKRPGWIVNVTALSSLFANVGQSNLAAAQGGVFGLTRTLANELKKNHVRVNAVAPVARTRMTESMPMFGPGGLGEDRIGPQFVAPAVVFLASPLCGELTGQVLSVAGSRVSLVRVEETPGLVGDDPRTPWTPAELRARWTDLARS